MWWLVSDSNINKEKLWINTRSLRFSLFVAWCWECCATVAEHSVHREVEILVQKTFGRFLIYFWFNAPARLPLIWNSEKLMLPNLKKVEVVPQVFISSSRLIFPRESLHSQSLSNCYFPGCFSKTIKFNWYHTKHNFWANSIFFAEWKSK